MYIVPINNVYYAYKQLVYSPYYNYSCFNSCTDKSIIIIINKHNYNYACTKLSVV